MTMREHRAADTVVGERGGRGHGFLEQKIFLRKIGVDESDGVDEKSKKK